MEHDEWPLNPPTLISNGKYNPLTLSDDTLNPVRFQIATDIGHSFLDFNTIAGLGGSQGFQVVRETQGLLWGYDNNGTPTWTSLICTWRV